MEIKDNGIKPMYLKEIQKYVAKLAPLSEQEAKDLDYRIYKDFFRMRPPYKDFLAGAVARCGKGLPTFWLESHCRYVVRLAELIGCR